MLVVVLVLVLLAVLAVLRKTPSLVSDSVGVRELVVEITVI